MPSDTADTSRIGQTILGKSGHGYLIKEVLQKTGKHQVCLATVGNEKFILKDVPKSQFGYIKDIYSDFNDKQHLRLAVDEIPESSTFIYKYFDEHLLNFALRDVAPLLIKKIRKDTLRGIKALHDLDIIHTDVKPNNIMINTFHENGELSIKEVALADIEDAARLGPRGNIVGLSIGNILWRSPEAHVEARVNKPSDIFSFGIVCIYAVTKNIIFDFYDDIEEGVQPLAIVLERQLSYFADEEGQNGLLAHIGIESPWHEIIKVISSGFNKSNPREPVEWWKGIDEDFRDLIVGLTKIDPARRITATEALQHKWFTDVE